jgi:hypothetical protein
MFHQARVLCLLACVAGWSTPGVTQPVYRCSDNSYSNKPCAGGKEVDVADPRTAAQREQAIDAARRDSKVAEELEKSRLKQEAKAPVAAMPLPVAEPPLESASDRTYSAARARKAASFKAVAPKKAAEPKAAKKKVKKKARKSAV